MRCWLARVEGGQEGGGGATQGGASATEGGDEPAGQGGGEQQQQKPDIVIAPLTVTAGPGGQELPETAGTITATDYAFEVDVAPGDSFTFRNRSSAQFHHAIVFDFGTLDPTVVEQNLPGFLQSEGQNVPEAFKDLDDKPPAGSGVFGPGGAGTADATFEAGSTYAVICFIQDRTGGPPHAFAYDMTEVFTVQP